MNTPVKQMSPGLTFAAGTLVGAIAVFVPFSSAGHAGPNIDVAAQRSSAAVRSSAPETAPNFLWWIGDDPRLAAKAQKAVSEEPKQDSANASNTDTCDVQLD
jgi:hypothetical protein